MLRKVIATASLAFGLSAAALMPAEGRVGWSALGAGLAAGGLAYGWSYPYSGYYPYGGYPYGHAYGGYGGYDGHFPYGGFYPITTVTISMEVISSA
jgi:hypothetical protein